MDGWMDGWMDGEVYVFVMYEYVWMDEWKIGKTDGRTDGRTNRWVGGKEERKKVWRKECILEMMGTDLPFSFHATV